MTYQSGMELFKAGKYPEAADDFHDIITADDQDHKAWNALGVTYTKMGQYESADTCYDNALKLASGTPAYERNRDKNRARMAPDDVLNVDDEPTDWKIPGKEAQKKTMQTPQLPTFTRPIWQYAVGFVLLIVLFAFVAGMGGGSHKATVQTYQEPAVTYQPTQAPAIATQAQAQYDNDKFIKSVILSAEVMKPLNAAVITDANNVDIAALKISSEKAGDQVSVLIKVINIISVSPELQPIKKQYMQALNDMMYGYNSASLACKAYESGDMTEFNYQLKEASSGMSDSSAGMDQVTKKVQELTGK